MSRRRHRLSLRETTFRLLRELGTRMLMIDEINSVLVGQRPTAASVPAVAALSVQRTAGRHRLCRRAGGAVCPSCRIRCCCAAASSDVALDPWIAGPELQDFVNRLVQGLPLRRPLPVDSVKLRRLLIERSGGITRSICRAIERAGATAIRNGQDRIDLSAPGRYGGLAGHHAGR